MAQCSAYLRKNMTNKGQKANIVPSLTIRKAFHDDDGYLHFLSGDSKGINLEIPNEANRFLNVTIPAILKAFLRILEKEQGKDTEIRYCYNLVRCLICFFFVY